MNNQYPSIGVFGFPKSGNTWVGNTFVELGRLIDPSFSCQFDLHICMEKSILLQPNPAFTREGEKFICFKSHYPRGYRNILPNAVKSLGVSHLDKIIILTRNPFDVLLSFINYSQFEMARCISKNLQVPEDLRIFISDYVGYSSNNFEKEWGDGISFEYLRDQGYLDNALERFGRYGLSIPMVYGMSSTWSSNVISWREDHTIPSIVVRYEDLIDSLSLEVEKISSFLNVNEENLIRAFLVRNEKTIEEKSKNLQEGVPTFYNKMTHGYFRQYFSQESLLRFYDKHHQLLKQCGYEDLEP